MTRVTDSRVEAWLVHRTIFVNGMIESQQSRSRLNKVKSLFQSIPTPASARGFGLSVYHCFSQVEDAVTEFERYTMGYVDSYLHDGREMMREAKQRRKRLQDERRRLEIS